MKASIVHPNVLITIGTLSYRFMDTHRLVEVKLSHKGLSGSNQPGGKYDDQRSRAERDQHSGSDAAG